MRLFILSLLFLLPGNLLAQQDSQQILPGVRVRLWAPELRIQKLVGKIVSVDADTLRLNIMDQTAPLAIPISSVTKFEVSRGKSSGARVLSGVGGAGLGFLGGAIVGGGIGGIWSENKYPNSHEGNGLGIFMGGIIGGGLGTLIGAVIGVQHPPERWQQAPLAALRVGLLQQGHGGFGLAASFSF